MKNVAKCLTANVPSVLLSGIYIIICSGDFWRSASSSYSSSYMLHIGTAFCYHICCNPPPVAHCHSLPLSLRYLLSAWYFTRALITKQVPSLRCNLHTLESSQHYVIRVGCLQRFLLYFVPEREGMKCQKSLYCICCVIMCPECRI